MCGIIERAHVPIYDQLFMTRYTFTIWIIGLCVLIYWCLELIIIRNIFRCSGKGCKKCQYPFCKLKFPIAFVMVLLSILCTNLSSTLFVYVSSFPSIHSCSFAPTAAILLRFLSKYFIWGFNIVRGMFVYIYALYVCVFLFFFMSCLGQMVIEMLENKYLNELVKHSLYILSSQMLLIFVVVLILSTPSYDVTHNECKIDMALPVIVSIIFIGEILYGIGFVYIFFKAMTTSMKRVINALRERERQKTRKQLIHHLTVYCIQFLLSSLYLLSIATCSHSNTFTLFEIFEAELLISNICVLTLFRGRIKWVKKHCYTKFRFCLL